MSQRLRDVKSYILLSLTLAAGGAIAVACGSDDDPDTAANPPAGSAGTSGSVGNAGAGGAPGAAGAAGSAGAPAAAAGANAGGSEGQPVDLPIDEPPVAQGGSGGEQPPAEPPPAGALAPNCEPAEGAVPNLGLELVASGLTEPLYVTGVPGDDSRLVIVQKGGVLRVVVDGVLQEAPFLDISDQTSTTFETGALGLAFHPNYAENGLLYVHFSSNATQGLPAQGTTIVAEYQVDAANRSVVNRASQRLVLTVPQPPPPLLNHKGGQLSFGPDGFLYLGLGDGGAGNDMGEGHAPIGNGQTLSTLLGKIVRINPTAGEGGATYTVPPANLSEVSGQQALPEIWAYGLRNPWRFSFDACTGDLYIGDVGQNALEEIDFVAAAPETRAIAAGLNFGWRIMEGTNCGPVAAECTPQTQAGLVLPVDTYGRNVGQSVTGGYVYRGSAIPGLRGHYLYADYATKFIVRFRIENGAVADRVVITDQVTAPQGDPQVENISSFGQDNAGEVYVVEYSNGAVYRIVQAQ